MGWETNENGVEGVKTAAGQFIPRCCIECQHKDFDEIDGEVKHLCHKNIRFPTRRGECKAQAPWTEEGGQESA